MGHHLHRHHQPHLPHPRRELRFAYYTHRRRQNTLRKNRRGWTQFLHHLHLLFPKL
jgi:hypothetical protein